MVENRKPLGGPAVADDGMSLWARGGLNVETLEFVLSGIGHAWLGNRGRIVAPGTLLPTCGVLLYAIAMLFVGTDCVRSTERCLRTDDG